MPTSTIRGAHSRVEYATRKCLLGGYCTILDGGYIECWHCNQRLGAERHQNCSNLMHDGCLIGRQLVHGHCDFNWDCCSHGGCVCAPNRTTNGCCCHRLSPQWHYHWYCCPPHCLKCCTCFAAHILAGLPSAMLRNWMDMRRLEYALWINVLKVGYNFTGMASHMSNSFNRKIPSCMKRQTALPMIYFGVYGS
jgi:hypothetical protein